MIPISFLHRRPRSYARSIAVTVIVCGQSPTRNLQAFASRVIAIRYGLAPAPVSIPRSANPALMPSLHSFVAPPPPFPLPHSSSARTQRRPSPRARPSTVQIAIIGTAELASSSAGVSTPPVAQSPSCPSPSSISIRIASILIPPHVRLPPSRLVCKYARIRRTPRVGLQSSS